MYTFAYGNDFKILLVEQKKKGKSSNYLLHLVKLLANKQERRFFVMSLLSFDGRFPFTCNTLLVPMKM